LSSPFGSLKSCSSQARFIDPFIQPVILRLDRRIHKVVYMPDPAIKPQDDNNHHILESRDKCEESYIIF
jgi:hypothetical protein